MQKQDAIDTSCTSEVPVQTVPEAITRLVAEGEFVQALSQWEAWCATHSRLRPSERTPDYLRALIAASYSRWWSFSLPEAERDLTQAYDELRQLPDSEFLGWCAIHLGNVEWSKGSTSRAKTWYEEALVSARRSDAPALRATCYENLAIVARAQARWEEAERLSRLGIAMARALGLIRQEYKCLRSVALIAYRLGSLEKARNLTQQCLVAALDAGSELEVIYSRLLLGLLGACTEDWASARFQYQEALTLALRSSNPRPIMRAREYLADVALVTGDAEDALGAYDRLLREATLMAPGSDLVGEIRKRRADALLSLGRKAAAYDEAREALAHCRRTEDRCEEAAVYRVVALSAAALGKPTEAAAWFERGLKVFSEIRTPHEWARLLEEYADWLSIEDPVKSRDAYLRAAELLTGMGASIALARVQGKRRFLEKRLATGSPARQVDTLAGLGLAADRGRTLTDGQRVAEGAPTAGESRPGLMAQRKRVETIDARAEWAREEFGIITRHPQLLNLLEQAQRLAGCDLPVLVLGESGVGKELVARGIHRLSARKGPFIPINCGGIPRELVESELFGHMRGAFTGAMGDKPGLLELAAGGTAFLDEVAEMPVEAQARLLRFLESGEVRRVGHTVARLIDVRIVAATNRREQDLEDGERLRRDLYYRLGNAAIVLPPLRQRGEDVAILLDYFWVRACSSLPDPPILTKESRRKLIEYCWPGNVRQLKQVIQRLAVVSPPGSQILPDDIELQGPRVAGSLAELLEEQEKHHIVEALKAAHGSRTEAARILGMRRTTLLGKMRRYALR
jgi:transcriptional regulator with AAA-type ATPase domain